MTNEQIANSVLVKFRERYIKMVATETIQILSEILIETKELYDLKDSDFADILEELKLKAKA